MYSPPLTPSDRNFGLFFCLVFLVAATYSWYAASHLLSVAFGTLALVFAFIALTIPRKLGKLNRLWLGIGLMMGRIVNPVVLGLLFFVLITPVALVTKLFGRDALRMKKKSVPSYWISREPNGPPPTSFKNKY